MTKQIEPNPEEKKLVRPNNNKRIVHVAIAETVFNYGKAQAYLSGLSWADFIESLIENSPPVKT